MKISEISNYIDSVLTFIIPFAVIFCLNLKIIFCIKGFRSHREGLLASMKINHRNRPSQSCSSSYQTERHKLRAALTSKRDSKDQRQQNLVENDSCYECKGIQRTLSTNRASSRHSGKVKRRFSESDFGGSVKPKAGSDYQPQGSSGQITPPFQRISAKPSTAALEIRVTKTLLLVSSVFLLLHFPAHSIRIASFIQVKIVYNLTRMFDILHLVEF